MHTDRRFNRRDLALFAVLFGTTVLAWFEVFRLSSAMHMPQMEPLSLRALIAFTAEWGVMMTAMMLPSAVPMILMYSRKHRHSTSSHRALPPVLFAATYLVIWMLTGIPVYLAWVELGTLAARSAGYMSMLPYAVAAVLLAAGIYQFLPAKHACLRQCVSPINFLVRYYRGGYVGSLRLATRHAVYCIGCCWLLMVLLVVGGSMSLPWVLVITSLVFVEKVLPNGNRTARIIGAMLIACALLVAWRPELAAVAG